MLNTTTGKPIAIIDGGDNNGKLICIDENQEDGYEDIELVPNSKLRPLMNMIDRGVYYIAGCSGSGKSTYAISLIKDYLKMYPETEFYIFSRTDAREDPAFAGIKINQIKIDESLLNNPIDIEKEIGSRSILFFDDCNTIQNDKLKKYIESLMGDIMEVGRKLKINIVITNHLVIPNEKKFARTILNELQSLTVFPKSGSSQQISYALKTYFGLSKKQINRILNLPSRYVTILKHYPMTVLYQGGVYIL
jgi:phosphoenolpyruvate synthase/pyruvate phosphate dikinase